jgi:hypothetical protein
MDCKLFALIPRIEVLLDKNVSYIGMHYRKYFEMNTNMNIMV